MVDKSLALTKALLTKLMVAPVSTSTRAAQAPSRPLKSSGVATSLSEGPGCAAVDLVSAVSEAAGVLEAEESVAAGVLEAEESVAVGVLEAAELELVGGSGGETPPSVSRARRVLEAARSCVVKAARGCRSGEGALELEGLGLESLELEGLELGDLGLEGLELGDLGLEGLELGGLELGGLELGKNLGS